MVKKINSRSDDLPDDVYGSYTEIQKISGLNKRQIEYRVKVGQINVKRFLNRRIKAYNISKYERDWK